MDISLLFRWLLFGGGAVLSFVDLGCRNRLTDCEQLLTCAAGGANNDETSGALGGAGSAAPAVPPVDCDPADGDCGELSAIYVSPSGNDGALGTAQDPVATFQKAIALALHQDRLVFACAGDTPYDETLSLTAEQSGVAVYGGFSCDDFSRNDTKTEVVAELADGHRLQDADSVIFGDVSLRAPDATEPGASSMVLSVVNSVGVSVLRSELVAGAGADGADGVDGSSGDMPAEAGEPGKPGNDACSTSDDANPGGAEAVTMCDGMETESVGGKGGPGGGGVLPAAGGTADDGQPIIDGFGGGGEGEDGSSCQPGGAGRPGKSGEHGRGAPGLGDLTATGYEAPFGGAGTAGAIGQGGGGGGGAYQPSTCDTGASGGSGGGGGCPGAAAGGGQSGGGSFGLVSFESDVVLRDVAVAVKPGGAGGAGGDGQLGGSGGEGAQGGQPGLTGSSDACDGGDGGRGGHGGSGGGGSGGPSVGVAYVGQRPIQESPRPVSQPSPEMAAPAGPGGNLNEAAAGEPGRLESELEF